MNRHLVDHFLTELNLFASLSGPAMDEACEKCPAELDLHHMALEHGWLEKILSCLTDKEFEAKRKEFEPKKDKDPRVIRKRTSSIDLTQQSKRSKKTFSTCALCNKELPFSDSNGALDHFSTHIWVKLQETNKKSDDLLNYLIMSLPLDKWLEHQGLSKDHGDGRSFMNEMKKRAQDIISGKWCCICLGVGIDSEQKYNHGCDSNKNGKNSELLLTRKHLSSVEDVETLRSIISPKKKTDTKPEEDSSKKEYCEWCVEGYDTDKYYEHTCLEHFRKLFEEHIIPENAKDMRCTLCNEKDQTTFRNKDELILHLAKEHKLLERYIHLIKTADEDNEKVHDVFSEMISSNEVTPGVKMYYCKKCNIKFQQIQELRKHVVYHIKKSWPLPKTKPYICPECYYEAHTYMSLFKHVGVKHGGQEFKKIYKDSPVGQKQLEPMTSNGTVQIQAKYSHPVKEKKIFTIEESRPKIKFSDFMRKNFKKAEAVKNVISSDDQDQEMLENLGNAEEEKMISNIHPPSRVSCLQIQEKIQNLNVAPHKWLCDGRLLMLENPKHENNITMFQEQWIRGQPVIVCNSDKSINKHLWHPQAFLKDYGHLRHDLVNCLTGKTIPKAKMEDFWSGFQHIKNRLKDKDTDTPMLLKLKDWPPSEDLANYMPRRFNDIINTYPLHEYTHREGVFNLAGYLPDYCLKPELGPKMYIAYGSALYSNKGSTNLHIDMSDAVNYLVYVGFPTDGNAEENAKEVFKEVDKAGCDIIMKRRIRQRNTLPGALWHIFHNEDKNKIRDFLNKVALEKGMRLDPHDDPIHDQSTYLDAKLRRRLYQEYGVRGYAIVQCAGDTIFIPAGAPHQVRNLHNCIKVAEDFVSPENISHCLHLTQEFRHLTEWHTNHEDKLQIKTILFHAIKTALAILKNQ